MKGGLDLVTVKPLARPGTLKQCLNYEVATMAGYTSLPGLARFDGSLNVGAYKVWRLRYTGAANALLTAGTEVWFDVALKGAILSVDVQNDINVLYVILPGEAPAPALPATLTSTATTQEIMSRDAIFDGRGEQDTFNTALKSITEGQSSKIGAVPGRAGSDIIGLFWYKDRLYAIRDLARISFEGGYYVDADEGKYLLVDGLYYLILDVAITGYQQGTITLDPVPYAGTPAGGDIAAPIGGATLVSIPVSGSLSDGYTSIPYSDGLTASGGAPPFTWSVVGEEGTEVDVIESPDANAISFVAQITNAGIYRSGATGWQRVDLGRELQFTGGTEALTNFVRSTLPLDTGDIVSTAHVMPTAGTVNGAASANMNSDNGTLAALDSGTTTDYQTSAYDFSAIPDNASIVGIEVTIDRQGNTGASAIDQALILAGVPGGTDNKARSTIWPNAGGTAVYGGPTDLWGSQQITPAVVKSALFGVQLLTERSVPATPPVGGVDYISIKVYYRQKDKQIYIWNGTSDVPMLMRHVQALGGDPALSTMTGYITVSADTNHDKPRLVNVGDTIRTGAGGTGDILGVVASRDRQLFPAGQAELDNNRARYVFERTNYYGQDDYEAVYAACGASPAWSFDGVRFIRIRTQLPRDLDLPRHVCRHGDMLVLGYFPGALVFSQPGSPAEMRSEQGATSVEVGDRLTNLAPLTGDALVVVCQSSTWVIRGQVPESFVKNPVSTKRGGIEYVAVDMGKYVLCDGLGVFVADSPESFGAAERNYMSTLVHPWLSPRLQATINSESAILRPIAALNVRNKNQLRLYFWDGWILTMTMNEPPEFTTQRYFTPAESAASEPFPWPVRALASGIDSSGREHIFCSFYGGNKEGYVFEMDTSRSFDGDPIPAQLVLNPLIADRGSKDKRYDRFHLYGLGYGVTRLTSSRYTDDEDVATGTTDIRMGRGDRTAKVILTQFRGVCDAPVEAFDISLRFDSNSDLEGPHALQYIEFYVDDRGDSRGRQGA